MQRTVRERRLWVSLSLFSSLFFRNVVGTLVVYVGEDRGKDFFPAREWLDRGVLATGGSDYPVRADGAMRSICGIRSRETVVGAKGIEHAITVN